MSLVEIVPYLQKSKQKDVLTMCAQHIECLPSLSLARQETGTVILK